MTGIRTRSVAAAAGLGLLLALGACKSDPGFADVSAESPRQFDVYLLGQEREDKGKDPDAALYGLTLNPLRVYRVPVASPIDAVDASPSQIVVQTYDGKDAHLGLLAADGGIGDIPGLGRPAAHDAEFLVGGRLRYTEDVKPFRYLEFDPATKRTRAVKTGTGLLDYTFGPNGSLLEVLEKSDQTLRVVTAQKTYRHKLPGRITEVLAGEKWIAVGIDRDSPRPDLDGPTLLIADSRTGQRFGDGFQGWAPLSWSADGKALLVRSTKNEYDKRVELGLVIVTGAAALRSIGTIPYLRMETGSWVRGEPVGCGDPYLCTSKDPSELGD